MTPRLSGHFSLFCLVSFVLKSLLGIARQWSREKFAILTLKPPSLVRIFDISNVAIEPLTSRVHHRKVFFRVDKTLCTK